MANTTNWLNISAQSGSSGETILTLSAQRNLSTDYKYAEITAYNPVYNISAKTYVSLASYQPFINVAPAIVGVPETGGTYELSITANCAYVIAYPDLVTSYSTSAATGNTTITFSVSGTYEETTLVGNIVITDESGQVSRTVRVEQYGGGAELVYAPGVIYIDSTGGNAYFAVSANCPYTITKLNDPDWFSVSPTSGYTGRTEFVVTAGENTGSTDVTGYISINGPGSTGGVVEVIHKKAETRLVVYYNVTSTSNPTQIFSSSTAFSKAELGNGTEIPLSATGYTFATTGRQAVYYTLTGTSIDDSSFQYCYKAVDVRIPNGVTTIGNNAFQGTRLSALTLPDTVTGIGSYSFGVTDISSLNLGTGLTTIGNWAFGTVSGLTSVNIPSSVTSIGNRAFYNSTASKFYFTSPTPATLGTSALNSTNLTEIIVPCLYFNDYVTAWPQYEQYMTCQDTELYFVTDTSNVAGTGETRTITILNTNINSNRTGLNLPIDFPAQGSYVVSGNTIYLIYPANPSSSSTRTWTIGVVAETNDGQSLSGSYQITQNVLQVVPIPYTADTSTITKSGETRTITIDTSGLVESSITISVEGATGVTTTYSNGVITVVFPYNNETSDRNIMIGISAVTENGDRAAANINYEQRGGAIIYVIPYTADTSIIDNTGETRTITIDTTGLIESSLTIDIQGATGVTTSYSSGTITVVFPSNAEQGRAITVIVHMRPIDGDDAYATIYYYQEGINTKGEYFAFKIETDGVIKWYASYPQHPESAYSRTIQYRKNNSEWTNFSSSTAGTQLQVSIGDIVEFRGNNSTYSTGLTNYNTFYGTTCKFSVFGNIMSLINSTNFESLETLSSNYTFNGLFYGVVNLVDASKLNLPATTLTNYCYYDMFRGCTSLISGPTILPSLTLASSCYENMFIGCYSLINTPVLPSTNLSGKERCYYGMFANCTNLTTAPNLPATTLSNYCYQAMFDGCTSLVNVQATLPASYIPAQAYRAMFSKCTSLTKSPDIMATSKINSSTDSWTLAYMFSGCTNLNYIKCMLPGNNGSADGFYYWVKDVSATGTFVTPSSSNWSSGTAGIPTGWTRVNA